MGGYNSGRSATQSTVEDGLKLDLGRLMRQGWVVPGGWKAGGLTWTSSPSGEHVATIGYEADLCDKGSAWLRLHYTVTKGDGSKVERHYRVPLETTRPHFGGVRWWFVCPLTGCRAAKLYLPPGADRFAGRTAWRLAYRSQRNGALFRAQDREARIVRKLGGAYQYPNTPTPPRPKWMRWKTYDRLCAELASSAEAQDVAFIAGTRGFMARVERMRARC